MYKNKKVLIYIPARNSEKTIEAVLDRIPHDAASIIDEVLIVDNKSKDATVDVVKEYSKKTELHLKLIENEKDLGYGGTQKVGYSYAIEHKFDYVIMLHSDGQYPPEKIRELVDKAISTDADMVFGSRIRGDPLKGRMSLTRYLGNRGLTLAENIVFRTRLSEFHSGFRLYNVHALAKINFRHCTDEYYFDSQIMFLILKKKMRITEITIPTHYGKESHSPNRLELFRYSSNILKELAKYVFKRGIYKD